MVGRNRIAGMKISINMTIGKRLEEFAIEQYGGISNLNRKITEITSKKTSIYKYVHNERSPGTSILVPLALLDCNINWLLTGQYEMLISKQVKSNGNHKSRILEVHRHLEKIQDILEDMYLLQEADEDISGEE